LTTTKKNSPSILGGTSLKDKLSIARKELDNLQNDDLHDDVKTQGEEVIEQAIKDSPKFHLTGRCNRKLHKYSTKAFYILDGLDMEIKRYCNGGDVAIFNYLMHLGLSEIKKREGHSFDEVSIMEDAYYIK
jgi:hypothetical protein